MKVFISWSGSSSKRVANALREWLPLVVPAAEPFMSEEDVSKGTRWATEITSTLAQCTYGVICITPDNGTAPWLTFEAGALSKSLDDRVSPLLVGLKKTDIVGPLTMFQATSTETEDVLRLVQSINDASGDAAIPAERVAKLFAALWPNLSEELVSIETEVGAAAKIAPKPRAPRRSEGDLLEEILERVRTQNRILTSPEELLPPEYLSALLGQVHIENQAMLAQLAIHVDRVVSLADAAAERRGPDAAQLAQQARILRDLTQMMRYGEGPQSYRPRLPDPPANPVSSASARALEMLEAAGFVATIRNSRGSLRIETAAEVPLGIRTEIERVTLRDGVGIKWLWGAGRS